jgi:hypothetical protein
VVEGLVMKKSMSSTTREGRHILPDHQDHHRTRSATEEAVVRSAEDSGIDHTATREISTMATS